MISNGRSAELPSTKSHGKVSYGHAFLTAQSGAPRLRVANLLHLLSTLRLLLLPPLLTMLHP